MAAPPARPNEELLITINEIFSFFKISFASHYYNAFPDDSHLNSAKKLWLEALSSFEPATIKKAAKKIILESDYLPTLHTFLKYCTQAESNVPSAHQAYIEACNAPSPKSEFNWSHPAVYEAGRKSDWFFLSTTPEQFAFPVFKNNYEELLKLVSQGSEITRPAIEQKTESNAEGRVSKSEGLANLAELKKNLDL